MGAAERALHQHLIDRGKHDLKALARRMNVPYSTLESICVERRALHVNRFVSIVAATRDIELFADVSGAQALGIVAHYPPTVEGRESIGNQLLRLEETIAPLVTEYLRATKDGSGVDSTEAARIAAKLPEAKRALAELESALKAIVGKDVRHLGTVG